MKTIDRPMTVKEALGHADRAATIRSKRPSMGRFNGDVAIVLAAEVRRLAAPRGHVSVTLPLHVAEALLAECEKPRHRAGSRAQPAKEGGWIQTPEENYKPNFDEAAVLLRSALARVKP